MKQGDIRIAKKFGAMTVKTIHGKGGITVELENHRNFNLEGKTLRYSKKDIKECLTKP